MGYPLCVTESVRMRMREKDLRRFLREQQGDSERGGLRGAAYDRGWRERIIRNVSRKWAGCLLLYEFTQ